MQFQMLFSSSQKKACDKIDITFKQSNTLSTFPMKYAVSNTSVRKRACDSFAHNLKKSSGENLIRYEENWMTIMTKNVQFCTYMYSCLLAWQTFFAYFCAITRYYERLKSSSNKCPIAFQMLQTEL
jgi:hypothetical protein